MKRKNILFTGIILSSCIDNSLSETFTVSDNEIEPLSFPVINEDKNLKSTTTPKEYGQSLKRNRRKSK